MKYQRVKWLCGYTSVTFDAAMEKLAPVVAKLGTLTDDIAMTPEESDLSFLPPLTGRRQEGVARHRDCLITG
jgi:hypothetical protein